MNTIRSVSATGHTSILRVVNAHDAWRSGVKRKKSRREKDQMWKSRVQSLTFKVANGRVLAGAARTTLETIISEMRQEKPNFHKIGLEIARLETVLKAIEAALTRGSNEAKRTTDGDGQVHGPVRGSSGEQQDSKRPELDVQQTR